MKYGQKCGGKNRKIGLTFYAPKCSKIFSHRKVGYYPPNKKFLDNFAITCDFEDQKAIFFKKMHFLARKWRFFKKIILFKIDQGSKLHHMHMPKNTFSNKVMRFHFSPDST